MVACHTFTSSSGVFVFFCYFKQTTSTIISTYTHRIILFTKQFCCCWTQKNAQIQQNSSVQEARKLTIYKNVWQPTSTLQQDMLNCISRKWKAIGQFTDAGINNEFVISNREKHENVSKICIHSQFICACILSISTIWWFEVGSHYCNVV